MVTTKIESGGIERVEFDYIDETLGYIQALDAGVKVMVPHTGIWLTADEARLYWVDETPADFEVKELLVDFG